jgi:hypothetical protein
MLTLVMPSLRLLILGVAVIVVFLSIIMLNVMMMNIVMMNIVMIDMVMLNVIMLNVYVLNVVMLNAVMTNVVMMNVVMTNVVAPVSIAIRNLQQPNRSLLFYFFAVLNSAKTHLSIKDSGFRQFLMQFSVSVVSRPFGEKHLADIH